MTSLKAKNMEKAQSMVEFAVSGIVILLLLVAIADFGRAFFTYLTLRDAAQEGAVYASVCPMHIDGIENRIRSASNRPVDLSDETQVTWSCHYIYNQNNDTQINECEDPGNPVNCDIFPSCSDIYEPSPSYLPIPGHGVRIKVEYPNFVITTPLLGSIIGQNLSLSAEVTDTILVLGNAPPDPCP
jgi:hypothetical protein